MGRPTVWGVVRIYTARVCGRRRGAFILPPSAPEGCWRSAPEYRRPGGGFFLGLLDMEKVVAKQRARFSVEGRARRLGVGMGRDSRSGIDGRNLNRRHSVEWEIINEKRGSICSSVK